MPPIPFRAPEGIRMVRIDRRSGHKVFGDWPTGNDPKAAVIWEAFKPESEPRRTRQAYASNRAEALLEALRADNPSLRPAAGRQTAQRRPDSDFLQREGGIY
jgi:penicillin-binding protein 1A